MTPQPLPPSPWVFDPSAWPSDDCVAAGADLAPATIIAAYEAGAFPMPHDDELLWWSPMMRGVLEPGALRVTRSLRKSIRHFAITVDQDFAGVIDACADPDREGAWIDNGMREAYIRLHELGWAHSVETRDADGALVGGLYGLCLGRLFAGESMFHRRTDASKAALAGLVDLLDDGFDDETDQHTDWLIDVQWQTPHLASLGVTNWPRERYLEAISGLQGPPFPPIWR
ncbi:MAG: leucyl/phenylalanyl-tRNA--protein transferase [Kineosporiaceae bacterium]|nr:leucyl/phenylalanyl-tRNA--protein transferase [Aeromicrobium sp.]